MCLTGEDFHKLVGFHQLLLYRKIIICMHWERFDDWMFGVKFFSLIKNSWIFVLFWRVLEILSFIKWKFLSSFLKYFSALLILFSNSFVVWHFRCELSFEVHCFCSSFFYLFGLCFASRKINKSSVFFRQCFFLSPQIN